MIVKGQVVRGQGIASGAYGVPTANIAYEMASDLEPGVYVGSARLSGAESLPALICYGLDGKFEVHLIDWSGDLAGSTLEVQVGERISNIVPFESEVQMREKVLGDLARAKELLK